MQLLVTAPGAKISHLPWRPYLLTDSGDGVRAETGCNRCMWTSSAISVSYPSKHLGHTCVNIMLDDLKKRAEGSVMLES